MAIANITNNILTDSGVATSSLLTTDTSQAITANKSFTVGFSLASEGSGNQTSFFRNTSSIFSGSGGSNIFGFNNSNNIYFGKGLNNGGVLQWNNTTATRYYTLPDTDGTIALTSQIPANAVGGTGTTNYLPKFTGASTIGNSIVQEASSNIGIGVSPSYKLEVYDSSTDAVALFNSANANGGHIRIAATNNVKSFIGSAAGFITSGGVDDLGLRAVGAIRFATNGAGTDMMLDTSGNLGLGVTPSAWSSGKAIEVGQIGNAIWGEGNGDAWILANAYYNTGFKYANTIAAGAYNISKNSHKWYIAPSGTAGNAITFTQAMTLFSTGNLLVGSPSPISDNGARLQVSGDIRISGVSEYLRSVQTSTSAQFQSWFASDGTTRRAILGFRSGGSDNFTLLNERNGSMFIGTNDATNLTIASTGAATFSSSVTAGGGNAPTLGFQLTTTTGTSTPRITNDNVNATVIRTGASGSPVVINNFANSLELVRFTDSGNVGIGTASPSAQLNVGHESHGVGISYLGSSALPSLAGIFTSDGTAGGQTGYGSLLVKARSDFGGFYSINFFTAASNNTPVERIRITSNGTLGFNGSAGVGNAGLDKMSMGYLNSNYGWIQTWSATPLLLNPSGNNVLIGTTTDAGVKLDVLGTARVSGNSTYAEFSLKDNTASGSTWFLLSGFPALGDFTIREAGVANHLVIKKTSGTAIFSSSVNASTTVTGPSGVNSVSNNNSIPFNTWTTIATVDAGTIAMYLVVIGLAAGGFTDWTATGILYSNGTTASWINGPTNGSLVQIRISGTAIQVIQTGTSPSINLSFKLLKVA